MSVMLHNQIGGESRLGGCRSNVKRPHPKTPASYNTAVQKKIISTTAFEQKKEQGSWPMLGFRSRKKPKRPFTYFMWYRYLSFKQVSEFQ